MSTKEPDITLSPLARAYSVAGLVALTLFGLVLADTTDRLALVPTLIGAAGLAFRWRTGPLLFIASVAIGFTYLNAAHDRPWKLDVMMPISNVILCAAGLCYVIAHYRLIGLTGGVFPREASFSGSQPPLRICNLENRELIQALIATVSATAIAVILWMGLKRASAPWETNQFHWRLGLLAWLLIFGVGLASTVLAYLGWRRLSRTEAALFLQDTLWHETRREQRRLNRWRAWALRRR